VADDRVSRLSALSVYIGSTLACSGELITIKNHDGTSSKYHQNMLNFYLIVSDDTYNAHYNTFNIVEAFSVVSLSILFLIFDVLLMTLCLAMYGQMQVICFAFQSVGHESLHDCPSPSGEYTTFNLGVTYILYLIRILYIQTYYMNMNLNLQSSFKPCL